MTSDLYKNFAIIIIIIIIIIRETLNTKPQIYPSQQSCTEDIKHAYKSQT